MVWGYPGGNDRENIYLKVIQGELWELMIATLIIQSAVSSLMLRMKIKLMRHSTEVECLYLVIVDWMSNMNFMLVINVIIYFISL